MTPADPVHMAYAALSVLWVYFGEWANSSSMINRFLASTQIGVEESTCVGE